MVPIKVTVLCLALLGIYTAEARGLLLVVTAIPGVISQSWNPALRNW